MNSNQRQRGRPAGAKTKFDTPGKKRARSYLDLKFDNELRPTKAARVIAEENGVEVFQIFKDAKRHEESVGVDLMNEAEQAKRDYENLLASSVGPSKPNNARQLVLWAVLKVLRNQHR